MLATQVDVLLAGIKDLSGSPLASGKVYTYSAGGTSNKTCWTDSGQTTAADNPVILNAYGRAQIYASGSYRFIIKDSSGGDLYDWDYLWYGRNDSTWGGNAGGSANAQTLSNAIYAYEDGQEFYFYPVATNTAAATLNVNGRGAKDVITSSLRALVAGDLQSGFLAHVVYDATKGDFILLNAYSQFTGGWFFGGTTGGAANAYTATLPSYMSGTPPFYIVCLKIHDANTGASTLALNGGAALAIQTRVGAALSGAEMATNEYVLMYFNGTNFILLAT